MTLPPLPHPDELRYALDWLRAGAPVVARGVNPETALRILLQLLDNLPSYMPRYEYGSPEWKEARKATAYLLLEGDKR